jgi:hypothetical protein
MRDATRRAASIALGPVLQHPRTDSITVLWETEGDVPGEIIYGTAGGKQNRVTDPQPVCLHRNALTGLAPATVYTYSLIVKERTLFHGSFKTLPADGPYRVVVFGDSHLPTEGFKSQVMRVTEQSPDLMIFLGDMITWNDRREYWYAFFKTAGDLFSRVPFVAAVGNHEVAHGTDLYDYFFGRPEGTPEGYYYCTFDIGPDNYIILDSRNDHLFFHHGFWLIGVLRALKRRTGVRYSFVFSHLGPVSYKEYRRGFIGLKPLLPLMVRAGVSAIFSGHDHHYVRGRIHRGFPFFVSGGGGGKLHRVNRFSPYGWFAGKKEAHAVVKHLLVLDIADGGCTGRAVDEHGSVFDEVTLAPRYGRAGREGRQGGR